MLLTCHTIISCLPFSICSYRAYPLNFGHFPQTISNGNYFRFVSYLIVLIVHISKALPWGFIFVQIKSDYWLHKFECCIIALLLSGGAIVFTISSAYFIAIVSLHKGRDLGKDAPGNILTTFSAFLLSTAFI